MDQAKAVCIQFNKSTEGPNHRTIVFAGLTKNANIYYRDQKYECFKLGKTIRMFWYTQHNKPLCGLKYLCAPHISWVQVIQVLSLNTLRWTEKQIWETCTYPLHPCNSTKPCASEEKKGKPQDVSSPMMILPSVENLGLHYSFLAYLFELTMDLYINSLALHTSNIGCHT